jgi:hypothetical protein
VPYIFVFLPLLLHRGLKNKNSRFVTMPGVVTTYRSVRVCPLLLYSSMPALHLQVTTPCEGAGKEHQQGWQNILF